MLTFLISSTVLIGIDLLTKYLAYTKLPFIDPVTVIPKIIRLVYLKNTGAAFGLLNGYQPVLIIVAAAILGYILYYINKGLCPNRMQYIGLIFLFSGTIGNLINRIFHGGVIDFIDFYGHWPVFNIADVFINVGIGLIIISILRAEKK